VCVIFPFSFPACILLPQFPTINFLLLIVFGEPEALSFSSFLAQGTSNSEEPFQTAACLRRSSQCSLGRLPDLNLLQGNKVLLLQMSHHYSQWVYRRESILAVSCLP
jgi:hypothetical protein